MRASGHGRDQVDIAFAQRRAFFGEGQHPGSTLAFGKILGLGATGILRAFDQRNQGVKLQGLQQIVAQAALINPGQQLAALLVFQRHRDARHQHRFAAQQMQQLALGQFGAFKIFCVGPDAHAGALLAIAALGPANADRLDHIATFESQTGDLTVAPDRHFKSLGQRIGDADAHAMQTA